MKFCKDCSHFRPQITIMGGETVHFGAPNCHISREPVYGSPQTCDNTRTRSGDCGPDAVNFEERPADSKTFEMRFWVSQDRSGSIAVEAPTPTT